MSSAVAVKSLLLDSTLDRSLFIKTENLLEKDRCDSCSSRALVRATKASSELLFCGHHGNKNAKSLVDSGWSLDDQTHIFFADEVEGNKLPEYSRRP